MGVYIKGMKMPESCGDCHCGYCDGNKNIAWCKFQFEHNNSVEGGFMWKQVEWNNVDKDCPLVEVPEPHGDLIDRRVLSNSVLKWLPPDPCGDEYKERPFETDICVSMMMEIGEQDAVIEAEGE